MKLLSSSLAFVLVTLALLQNAAAARRHMLEDTAILGGASSFNFGFSSGSGSEDGSPEVTVAESTTTVGSFIDSDEDVWSSAYADSVVVADQVGADTTAFVYGDDSTSTTDIALLSTYPTRSGESGFVNANAKSSGGDSSRATSTGNLYSSNDVYDTASFGSSLAFAVSYAVGNGGDETESESFIEVQTETEAIPLPGWSDEEDSTWAQGAAITSAEAQGGSDEVAGSESYIELVTEAAETQGPTETDVLAKATVEAESSTYGLLSSQTMTGSSVSAFGYADENGGTGSSEHAVGSGQADGSGAASSEAAGAGTGYTASENVLLAYVAAGGGLGEGVSDFDQANGVQGSTVIGFSDAVAGGSAFGSAEGNEGTFSYSDLTGDTKGKAQVEVVDANGEASVYGLGYADIAADAEAAGFGTSTTSIEGLAQTSNLLAASTDLQDTFFGTTGTVVASGDYIGGGFIDSVAVGDLTETNAHLFGDTGGEASALALHGNAAGMGHASGLGALFSDASASTMSRSGVGSSEAVIEGLAYGEAETIIDTENLEIYGAEIAESQTTSIGHGGAFFTAKALGDMSSASGLTPGDVSSGAIAAVSGSEYVLGSGAEGKGNGQIDFMSSQDSGDEVIVNVQNDQIVVSEASLFAASGGGPEQAGYFGDGSSMVTADGTLNGNIVGDVHSGKGNFHTEGTSYTLQEEEASLDLEGYSGSGTAASGAAFADLQSEYESANRGGGGTTILGDIVAGSSIMSEGTVITSPDDSTAISVTADLTASGFGDGEGEILANGDYASKEISVGGEGAATVAGATTGFASLEDNYGLASTTAGGAGEGASELHLSVSGEIDGFTSDKAGARGTSGAYATLDGEVDNDGVSMASALSGGYGTTQASAETDPTTLGQYGTLDTSSASYGSTTGAAEALNEGASALTEYETSGELEVESSGEGVGPMKHNSQTGVDASAYTGILTDVDSEEDDSISVVDAGAGIVGVADTDAWVIDVAGLSSSETSTGVHTPSEGLSPLIIDPLFYGPGRITDEDWFFVNLADSLGFTVGQGYGESAGQFTPDYGDYDRID